MKNYETKYLIQSSIFLALIIIGAYIKVLFPVVPLTFQPFFVMLCGLILNKKYSALTLVSYIVLGLIGIPVFSSGGGLSYIFQPTFGFIIGFLFGAITCSLLVEKFPSKRIYYVIAAIIGLLVINIFGYIYLVLLQKLYYGSTNTMIYYLMAYVLPYIPKDIIAAIFAGLISFKLKLILSK